LLILGAAKHIRWIVNVALSPGTGVWSREASLHVSAATFDIDPKEGIPLWLTVNLRKQTPGAQSFPFPK
jgi:hypothetical protein